MKKKDNIPNRFPFEMGDRSVSFLRCILDPIFQAELEFAGHLDEERLAKAIDLTLEAEPILGCQLVIHPRKPYWERLDKDKSEREVFLFTESEGEYEAFKSRSIDPCRELPIKVCLWRSFAGDRLLVKVAHEVADGGGTKEVGFILSSIYSRLANEPNYQPEPNVKGSRSIWQVLRHVPWYAYPRIYLNYRRSIAMAPYGVLTLPLKEGPHTSPVYIHRLVPAVRVARLSEYGHAHNATLSDLVLAAFFRALVVEGEWDGKAELKLTTTVDLRRYLPTGRGGAIANLSALEYPSLGTDLGDDFASTLERVTAVTRRQKANWIGLKDLVGGLLLFYRVPYDEMMEIYRKNVEQAIKNHNFPNCLTNAGPISPDSVTFDVPLLNIWPLPPPSYPPHFTAALSGYAGTLTLSAGVYSSQKDIIERFFDAVLFELPE